MLGGGRWVSCTATSTLGAKCHVAALGRRPDCWHLPAPKALCRDQRDVAQSVALGRISSGRVPGTPMLGPWHGKASAASHDPPRPHDMWRQQGTGELVLPTEVLLRQRWRELLHSLLVCLTSGAGDDEASSRGKSVDGTERTWQPGSAVPLEQLYCTVLYRTCACECACLCACVLVSCWRLRVPIRDA